MQDSVMVRAYSVDWLLHLHYKVFLTTLRQRSGIRHHASFVNCSWGAEDIKNQKMKKLTVFVVAMTIAIVCSAQDVTKFLGIPVDGTKPTMIQKLKAKGYTYNVKNDCLEGEFNGRNVEIRVVTNNNKVYRIVVADALGSNETSIRIRFNTLCQQFSKNEKYIPADLTGEFEINEGEDISYEMLVHNKRYEAAFYQINSSELDSAAVQEYALAKIAQTHTMEELEKLSDDEKLDLMVKLTTGYFADVIAKKSVWFMIEERYGSYYVYMFYDNEYNRANGEDL